MASFRCAKPPGRPIGIKLPSSDISILSAKTLASSLNWTQKSCWLSRPDHTAPRSALQTHIHRLKATAEWKAVTMKA
jgi:hypothetical protein